MKGEINLKPFVTHTGGLQDINKAFDLMHEGRSIRTVVNFAETADITATAAVEQA